MLLLLLLLRGSLELRVAATGSGADSQSIKRLEERDDGNLRYRLTSNKHKLIV